MERSEIENPSHLVPAIALMRVAASLALSVKAEMMCMTNCAEVYKTDWDWSKDAAEDYARLCPAKMLAGRDAVPQCEHWPVCFDALRLRKLAGGTADYGVSLPQLSEVRDTVAAYLLKQGPWRSKEVQPTPGRSSIVGFVQMLTERLFSSESPVVDAIEIYRSIGGVTPAAYMSGGPNDDDDENGGMLF